MTPQTDVPAVVVATPTLPTTAPKSGFVSSEFVATVLGMIALMVPGIPDQYMPLIAAIVGVYAACRTLLKVLHTMGYVKSVPDLPALPSLPAGSVTTSTTVVPKV